MTEHSDRLDRAIDEALRALTDGPPANGLRRRVLARIATAAEPAPRNRVGAFIWRGQPLWPASVVAVAVLAGTGALFVSRWFEREPTKVIVPATASVPAEQIWRGSAVATRLVREVEPVETLNATKGARPRLAAPPHENIVASAAVTGEDADPDPAFSIVLLRDPTPIVDRPIEIALVVIEPVANREIQDPMLEADRPPKAPGQTDKR
jgi:hypothetical protein